MKRLLAIIMTMLAVPTIASATDFTNTDQLYGWNGTAQIWQTWADHKTQLGLLFYTESEIDTLLAAKADKTNISFVASSLTDLKILTAAQPVNGEAIISDTITPGDADDDKRVATVERNAELYQPLNTNLGTWAGLTPHANFQTMVPHTFAQMRDDLDLEPGVNVQPLLASRVDGSASGSLSAAQVSGTIIRNYGQGAGDVALVLPTAAGGYNALFQVTTVQSNKWGVQAGSNDKIYLLAADGTISAGTDNGYARMTAAQIGQSFACWTEQTGASAYDWFCKAGSIGTSTFAAN